MSDKFDNEIAILLKTVVDHFNNEDRVTRERQIRHWRRLKLYWNSFSQIYWSESARDYRIVGRDIAQSDTDQDYYDKPVNVFRAFLETIIAALSIQIPKVNCVPDDADNPNDLSTAKAGAKISELIYKHNDVIFLWLHALYIWCTEGMIACYSYPKEDKKFGTYETPKFKDEEIDAYVCPNCGARVPDELFSANELNEFMPSDNDVDIHSEINQNGPICIECGTELDSELQKTKLIVPRLVGVNVNPKSRICLEVYGGLYIKVANYAKKQEDTPYLIFSYETHYANALECYPNLRDRMPHGGWSNIGVNDPYEQYGRLNTQYRGEFPNENVTVKNAWLRVSAFNILPEDQYKKLKKLFPDGVRVSLVNDICADYENEALDDCWTLTQDPMSDFLNHDPLGELLTNIQDITNDLISLTLQTIEHGIAQTMADPAVFNFNAQRQVEAQPGTITPIKPQAGGKNIGESFYTLQTASLSPEIFNFYRIVQELGQFVSGALPSLFGGQLSGGSSRTASEYAMSKGMALQRLQTPWKMMIIWWKDIFGKVIPMYIKTVKDDERMVEKDDLGNFINVFIRKAELVGKIGSIELEPDENLPVTDAEKADAIMKFMTLNNDEINQALLDPENLPFMSKVIKIPEFRLPGSDDRQKQYEEISQLINEEPITIPPQTDPAMGQQMMMQNPELQQDPAFMQSMQPIEQPSVDIDIDVDNNRIEASICRSWLISSAGRLAKIENPSGYKNVLLHMKAHLQADAQQQMQMQMQAQAMQPQPEQTSGEAPAKKPKQSEKIDGAENARTPIS